MKELREELGWKQRDLAARLDVVPSWVSQVEAGRLRPGSDRLAMLAMLLGPRFPTSSVSGEERNDLTRLAYPCLWRARADTLERLAIQISGAATRVRLSRLSKQLLGAAARHPLAREYGRSDTLPSLYELSAEAPEWLRRTVLAEVAGMRLEAPHRMKLSRAAVRGTLELLAEDLRLSPTVGRATADARLRVQRDMPAVSEKAKGSKSLVASPIGGSLGRLAFLGTTDESGRVLVGDDPSGWLGFSYAAGAWLVRDAAGKGGEAPKGPSMPAALAYMLDGSSPVLAASFARVRQPEVEPSAARSVEASVRQRTTADRAIAFGGGWVRAEVHKLASLYSSGMSEQQMGLAGLPIRRAALSHLQGVADVVESRAEQEASESGLKWIDDNGALCEMADVKDSLDKVIEAMRS